MDIIRKNKIIRSLKYAAYAFLGFFILIALALIYLANFTPYDRMLRKGLDNFPELLELAQQSEPKDNPYLSSEIQPDHPLYQALLAKQSNFIETPLTI